MGASVNTGIRFILYMLKGEKEDIEEGRKEGSEREREEKVSEIPVIRRIQRFEFGSSKLLRRKTRWVDVMRVMPLG